MQTVRVLVQSICSYLGGSATAEESAAAQKDLDHIDQELGASSHGLLDDQEVHRLEDDLAVVYYQLGAAVRNTGFYSGGDSLISGLVRECFIVKFTIAWRAYFIQDNASLHISEHL